MSDQLQQYLATLMRSARTSMDAQRQWNNLSAIGIVLDDYFASCAKVEALAKTAQQLTAPAVPLNGTTPPTGRPLMPHEQYEEMDGGGNPALREALLRRGD